MGFKGILLSFLAIIFVTQNAVASLPKNENVKTNKAVTSSLLSIGQFYIVDRSIELEAKMSKGGQIIAYTIPEGALFNVISIKGDYVRVGIEYGIDEKRTLPNDLWIHADDLANNKIKVLGQDLALSHESINYIPELFETDRYDGGTAMVAKKIQ